ncbi:MAG: hypothetical protein GY754_04835 [bacterium]|nr:hypothetical protein [bacterium]
MKIITDFNEIAPGRARRSTIPQKPVPRAQNTQKKAPVNTDLAQSVRTRATREKTLGDALSIAQMSQAVIQRAIVISSRLRSIAAEAMTTGRIDTAELELATSDIRSSMGDQQQEVAAPPPKTVAIPAAAPEINNMQQVAEEMTAGRNPGPERLEGLIEALGNKSAALGGTIGQIKDTMGELVSAYPEGGGDIPGIVSGTANAISGQPGSALLAQGNISHDTAKQVVFEVNS